MRVGIGYDSHRFADGGPMVLGGISIDSHRHLSGHSDGDAICHAVTDAILGAAGLGDIGSFFPDTDPSIKGVDSVHMLRVAVKALNNAGWLVGNVDITVVAERQKISPHREKIRERIAHALNTEVENVFVKGKTNEGMGWIGRDEGIAVMAVTVIIPSK